VVHQTVHTIVVVWIRISFIANPDQAFYLNADPDPRSQTNADPDPVQTFKSQKVENLKL
jgi:hypothetical protein